MAIRTSVDNIEELCFDVNKITIIPVWQEFLPPFDPGSNVDISVLKREDDIPTPYSIVSACENTESYEFIVAGSRSGKSSKNDWIIDNLNIGDMLDISEPRRGIVFSDSREGCFIAGGSGITAFLSHFNSVDMNSKSYYLCHVVRDRSEPFFGLNSGLLASLQTCSVVTSEETAFDIDSFLEDKRRHIPIYVSGSRRLIEDVIDKAVVKGWSYQDIYWDRYALPKYKFDDIHTDQCS